MNESKKSRNAKNEKTAAPTLAIVIPVFNEAERIAKCLRSILDQTLPADEIIIVDNNSTDDSVKIVQRFIRENPNAKIQIIHEKQQGIVPARNRGFNAARSEILGRIDADSTIDETWVAAVKEIFRDPKVMAATGPVVYNDLPLPKMGLWFDNFARVLRNKTSKYLFLFGSNMAIRTSAWAKVKDKTYFALAHEDIRHEDIDLSLCLAEENLQIVYSPKMIGGMSARRVETSPKEFAIYNRKFSNAFKYRGLKTSAAVLPKTAFWVAYLPMKFMRFLYKKTHKIEK